MTTEAATTGRVLGWTGERVPAIGQGTWRMEKDDRAQAVRALRAGLDLGLTHVDTAEMYGSGRVESIVGEAIAGRRDEVFLVSKVLPSNASWKGTVAACEASLKRLGTDRLDLYLLHWTGSHPLADTIRAFEELVLAGKIRFWGVSNFDASDLDEALAVSGPRRIACNQVLYHLEERAIEHRVAPWCAAHDVAVVGYSPFGAGAFPSASSRGGQVLAAIARARGATPRQVALAFLLRDPRVFVIPKASKESHVRDNAAAASLVLAPEEVARIDAVFPRGPAPRGVPTL
jgi:diketogulonate reductase-like aldo/keto reductase